MSVPGMISCAAIIASLEIEPEQRRQRVDLAPFGDAMCEVVEDTRPEVVSFHFGLPAPALLARVKAAGCKVISTATTVEEARWLEQRGGRDDARARARSGAQMKGPPDSQRRGIEMAEESEDRRGRAARRLGRCHRRLRRLVRQRRAEGHPVVAGGGHQ